MNNLPLTPMLSDLAQAMGGQLHGQDKAFTAVEIDTRRLQPRAVFVALQGEHQDGHRFLPQAQQLGAAAAVVERYQADCDLAQIVVKDGYSALQKAGQAWRTLFAGPVVGVTGSNGKTTVRKLLQCLLAQKFDAVLATEGNYNNHLGVPLTLLRLRQHHQAAVIEMGASHQGEIAELAAWSKPDIGIVTNAGDAHIEGFGSRDGVAKGKGELFAQLPANGTAIINADDAYQAQWTQTTEHCQRQYFAINNTQADVRATDIELTEQGSRFTVLLPNREQALIQLPLAGKHNVANAVAAAAAAHVLGCSAQDIAQGLAAVTPVSGRLAIQQLTSGVRLVDDSYNANPNSVAAGLEWLSQQTGPRWFVLGDMGELGNIAEQAHAHVGQLVEQAQVEQFFATGTLSQLAVEQFTGQGSWHAQKQALIEALQKALKQTSQPPIILIKGSRSAGLEQVVAALSQQDTSQEVQSC